MNINHQTRHAHVETWKIIATICGVILFLGILVSFFERVQYDAELDGQEIRVEWSILNLREDGNFSADIICDLTRGDVVELTGNHRYYSYGDPDLETHWYECNVTLDDGDSVTGWVVVFGLDWKK